MKATGDPVSAAAELAARVKGREHDLDGGSAVLRSWDRLHRDTAPVVGNADRAVGVDRDDDLVGMAGHRLVDRVVDYLVDEVVQASGAGGADVHPRAVADVLYALENGMLLAS